MSSSSFLSIGVDNLLLCIYPWSELRPRSGSLWSVDTMTYVLKKFAEGLLVVVSLQALRHLKVNFAEVHTH